MPTFRLSDVPTPASNRSQVIRAAPRLIVLATTSIRPQYPRTRIKTTPRQRMTHSVESPHTKQRLTPRRNATVASVLPPVQRHLSMKKPSRAPRVIRFVDSLQASQSPGLPITVSTTDIAIGSGRPFSPDRIRSPAKRFRSPVPKAFHTRCNTPPFRLPLPECISCAPRFSDVVITSAGSGEARCFTARHNHWASPPHAHYNSLFSLHIPARGPAHPPILLRATFWCSSNSALPPSEHQVFGNRTAVPLVRFAMTSFPSSDRCITPPPSWIRTNCAAARFSTSVKVPRRSYTLALGRVLLRNYCAWT